LIAIGCDHAGFCLKEEILCYLKNHSLEYKDFGTYSLESVDYPQFALAVAEAVASGECDRGILICGTGIGISIAANKVTGIRAALCMNSYMARMTRMHNDSNIIALGGRTMGVDLALDTLETWLSTEFLGGKHQVRLDKLAEIERKYGDKNKDAGGSE
jgi:ribose 5-phosphate isomerase B